MPQCLLMRLAGCAAMALLVVAISAHAKEAQPGSPEQAAFFEKRVRPLLVEHCHGCHGARKQEAGLRLDSRDSMLKGSDAGPVVLPGKPQESRLVEVIGYESTPKMPPSGKLPSEALETLTTWISQGLPWPADAAPGNSADAAAAHWAFQPVKTPPFASPRRSDWAQNEIDRFILRAMEAAQLEPAPPADRRTLARRASFDLLGLPPEYADVAAFEADPRPTPVAFARLVDQLLESPHYGERWGRYWLDVARYADNKGYVFFEETSFPWSHTYRDWVIEAFNNDMPFNRMIELQLAADLAPGPKDPGALAALGFLTIGGHFMNNVHDIFDDRIDVVSRGLLGLTASCARCHDHKYDPIPQADYYALYGVFRSCSEPVVPPPVSAKVPETEEYEHYILELASREKSLKDFLAQKHRELVTGARERVAEYLLAANASRDQPSTEDFMLLIPEGDLHPAMVQRYWLYLRHSRRQHDPVWAPWHALAELPESEFSARAPGVCAEQAARAPAQPINPRIRQALLENPPASLKEAAERYARVLLEVESEWRQRLEAAQRDAAPAPLRFDDPALEELRLVFHADNAPANFPAVAGWGVLTLLPDRQSQAIYQERLRSLESWLNQGPAAPPRAMVLVDDAVPFEPRVFLRGNPNRQGAQVPRGFFRFLAADARPFERGSGRWELAQAITDRRNPLTARVFVNRVWLHHFGLGLVRTPSDFGTRSEAPSHPELLDFLAATFMDQGWSIKNLHRLIMNSATWQQSTRGTGRAPGAGSEDPLAVLRAAVDPDNRLLSGMRRRRLDFEALRDALLAVSGRLDRTRGGPPVDLLGGSNRRTVYGFINRLSLPGLLRTFDFPSPDATSPQRDSTTVAPQALYLMNGPLTDQCAKSLVERPEFLARQGLAERVEWLYTTLFSRRPAAADVRMAEEFLGSDAAAQREQQAWQRYVHALLLTNEFVFVD
jgi:cytochrome c553